jgi:hypothetical protein
MKSKRKFVKYGILILCLLFCWHACLRPDPENKRKFKRTLGVALTPDVKDIHYYGDFFAIDYTVSLAFTCDSSTIKRIIAKNGLNLAADYSTGMGTYNISWWDDEIIKTIRPFKNNAKYDGPHRYLWYDKDNKKAYYQEFSM